MEFMVGLILGFIGGFLLVGKMFVDIQRDHAMGKAFEVDGKVYRASEIKEAPHA